MSSIAPWLALAVDWDESEMWDALPQYGIEKEATMGERLAWVCLLCDAKVKGRGGKVSIRKTKFIGDHRLTGRSVDGMLARAQKCGAATIDGELITLCNWPVYQDKKGGRKGAKPEDSPGSAVPITHHPSPITNTPSSTSNQGSIPGGPLPSNWAAAAAGLREEGVRKADEACQRAIANGCSPTDVQDLLCHFRGKKPAWNGQDLYFRVIDLHPGEDFTANWRPEQATAAGVYLEVTADEFREYFQNGKFKEKPTRHATKTSWVFGTLKNGTKVECKDYPPPK